MRVLISDPPPETGASFVVRILQIRRDGKGILLHSPAGRKDRLGAGIALGTDRHTDCGMRQDQL